MTKQFSVTRTDPSGANYTRRNGWVVREDGDIIAGPVFSSRKQALEWCANFTDPRTVRNASAK